MTDKSLSVQQLEASAVVIACGLFQLEHLNIVTDSMFVTKLCLAMSRPGVSASSTAVMIEEALASRQGTISVIHIVAGTPSFVVEPQHLFYSWRPEWAMHGTYWCPSSNPGKNYCTYPGYWFCGYWGCETIVTSNVWKPPKKDEFLDVKYWPHALVLQPQDKSWATGKMWSVFMHMPSKDWSAVVQVIRTPLYTPTNPEPNQEAAARVQSASRIKTTPKPIQHHSLIAPTTHPQDVQKAAPYDLFYHMLDTAFQSLNTSKPNLTNSCWLCYDTNPPFYEGIALDTPFTHSNDLAPKQCRWNTPRKGVTLGLITGQGICVGNQKLIRENRYMCKTKVVLKKSYSWAIPSASGLWACHQTGATPCISIKHFDFANNFCVQVAVVPRVLYHTDDEMNRYVEGDIHLQKRELITGVTLAFLLGLGATGTQSLRQLQMTIDEDLQRIEERLAQREKDLDAQRGWFDSFFSHSPWVLPLLSTLMGPVLTILFVLIFGPCVLNKITQFVKARLSKINITFLEQRQLT
uniref:Envelope polyprotein n=1 Tax=Cyanoderma ruficeps TaxID=181631 RepID=A0A8C3QG58_9PASS